MEKLFFNPQSAFRIQSPCRPIPLSPRLLRRAPHSALRSQLGVSLLWLLILLPAVLLMFMAVQGRLQQSMAATRRGEDRAQARLLAESALLMLQDNLKSKGVAGWADRAMPMGEIPGKGVYQVSIPDLDSTASTRRIVALGRVAGPQGPFLCEIQAEVGATTPTATPLRVTGISYRIDPVSN